MHRLRIFFPHLPVYLVIGCIFGFSLWTLYIPMLSGKVGEVFAGVGTEGDPYTVCDSGCDYTSVDAALNDGISDGSYIQIQSPHTNSVSTSLNWESLPSSVYISCASTDIVFATGSTDYDLNLAATTTIDSCTIGQANVVSTQEGISIKNNIFTTNTPHTLASSVTTTNWTVTNNTGLMLLDITGGGSQSINGCTDCTVSGNTFHIVSSTSNGLSFSGTNVQVFNNTFDIFDSEETETVVAISSSTNALFATNTVKYSTPTVGPLHYIMTVGDNNEIKGITNLNIRGNLINFPDPSITSNFITLQSTSSVNFTATIEDNTFVTQANQNIINFSLRGSGTQSVSASYNIFYSASSTAATSRGFNFESDISTTTLTYNDYNSFYNLITNYYNPDGSSGTIGANSITTNPFFSDATNYGTLSDFSACLDVNGTRDIGHLSQTRDGTIPIGSARLITQMSQVTSTLRANDAVNFDAGTFNSFTLSTSNITITGQGETTIISADTNENAVVFNSADSNTIQDLVVSNASSTQSSYYLDRLMLSYGGNDYNDDYDVGAETMLLLTSAAGGCNSGTYNITADDYDATSIITDIGSVDVNLVLTNIEGIAYFPVFMSDDVASSEAAYNALSGAGCPAADLWIADVFTRSGSTYTLNSSAISSAGASFLAGFENPELSNVNNVYAGIKFINSDSNVVQNVTSTDNGYGIWFNGSSENNIVSTSTVTSSAFYDIYDDATTDNSLKNVDFVNASSSISGTGNVDVYYKARAYVTSATSSNPLSGVSVSMVRADEGQIISLTSDATGYTPFSDFLLAFTMSSTSIATTNGGYNPWEVGVTASGIYAGYSASETIDSYDETVSVELSAAGSAPSAPSDFTASSVSTSSIEFTWTDNSSGAEQEDNFILDYITGSDTGDFPGTISNPVQDATSATVSGLSPNTQYTFRLAATNGSGTSAYTTSSAMYTDPVAPGTPTVSSNGQTSLIVAWSANGNGDGTTYEVYNVTTGASAGTTTATSLTVSGLSAGTSYQFKVRAEYLSDAGSYSSYSSNSSAVSTDAASTGSSGAPAAPPAVPSAPPGALSATVNIIVTSGQPKTILVGTASHTVSTSIFGGKAIITIKSDPVVIELAEGEEKLVDTNKDGEDDLFVRVNKISGSSVDLTISSIGDLEFSINKSLSTTDNREAVLYFNSPDAVMLAISNSDDFSGIAYESYSKTKEWDLSPGNGQKTVYVKLRTAKGGEKIISDTVMLTGQSTYGPRDYDGCVLKPGEPYKYPNNSAVYYITDSCTKKIFNTEEKFFSYFDSWSDVFVTDKETLELIPDDKIKFIPWGPNYKPKYGSLVKIITDPKVYLLTGIEKHLIGSRQWVVSENIFEALGYAWNWIEDVSKSLLDKYTDGFDIDYTDHHPNYSLIRYKNSSKVYRLESDLEDESKQVKRWIVDGATFRALGLREDRIIEVDGSEVYSDGDNLVVNKDVEGIKISISGYEFENLLYRGLANEEVKQLQIRLQELGFFPKSIEPNGVFGKITEQAVRDFQSNNGIDSVGYVGPLTRETLNSL